MSNRLVRKPETATAPARPWLSIVLPAHNEASNIGRVVRDFLGATENLGRPVEIVVVDDGSRDGTHLAADVGSSRVHVVRHRHCRGYGGALIAGFAAARGEWVFFTDGDGQFSAAQLPTFVRPAMAHTAPDAVIGYRHPRHDPWARRLLGRGWTTLTNTLLRLDVRDVNCAYKLVRRQHLAAMGLTSTGAMINAELLHKARRRGMKVVQRPVDHQQRQHGEATGARPEVVIQALADLAGYRLKTLGEWAQDNAEPVLAEVMRSEPSNTESPAPAVQGAQ